MFKDKIIIGSRGSQLALWQANWVCDKLKKIFPSLLIEIRLIKTTGDKILDVSLSKIGDKGLFTKEIEQALLDDKIDVAVHSLKDLPTSLPPGLKIGAVSERMEQRDAFISKNFESIEKLPNGSKIGTGSLRRKSQLLNYRPDLKIMDLRGNIMTRIKKYESSDWGGIVLAYAGLKRLQLDKYIKQIIPTEILLPAVSQGVMALEIREHDDTTYETIKAINNADSEIEIKAERSFLKKLQGGCQVPIGIYSKIVGDEIEMEGMVGSLDGKIVLRDKLSGNVQEPEKAGEKLADNLLEKGASDLLELIREN